MENYNLDENIDMILQSAKECITSAKKLESLIGDCNNYLDKKLKPPQYILDFAEEVYALFISENKHISPDCITYITELYIKTMVVIDRLKDQKYISKEQMKKFYSYKEKINEIFEETNNIIKKNLKRIIS